MFLSDVIFVFICSKMAKNKVKPQYNVIKARIAEKQKTNQGLAEHLGVAEETVSSWCTNTAQPSIKRLFKIAEYLDINVQFLLAETKPKSAN